MFNKSKTLTSPKKKNKLKLLFLNKFWRKTISLLLLISASLAAYLYFFKKSNIIEIFPDDSIIKIKTKINTNLEDLIKKDSIVYDIIMKKRELDGKKTQLSESTEDPISVLLNKDSSDGYIMFESDDQFGSDDIFSKYSCIDPNQKNQFLEPQSETQSETQLETKAESNTQSKKYNFTITENQDMQGDNLAEKLKSRQRQKYFYCDLNYFYDKNQAEKEYTKIRYIYAKIISPYEHTIYSKQKDDKYIYVLSIGKFSKFEDARSLCRKLIVQKQNCMVNQR